jgi:hypothetical protein
MLRSRQIAGPLFSLVAGALAVTVAGAAAPAMATAAAGPVSTKPAPGTPLCQGLPGSASCRTTRRPLDNQAPVSPFIRPPPGRTRGQAAGGMVRR